MPNERSTDMEKFSNIEELKDDVKRCVEFHGFKAEENKYANLGLKIVTDTGYTCIDIYTDLKWDFENREVIQSFDFAMSICRMGGRNTPEEFRTIADEMVRVAELVEVLNHCGYKLATAIPAEAK